MAPGCLRACSISSRTLVAGNLLATTSVSGLAPSIMTGAKLLLRIVRQLRVHRRQRAESGRHEEKRMAVGIGAGGGLDGR